MRKLLAVPVLLITAALALGACNVSAAPYAAKVGTATIPTSQLNGVLREFQTNTQLNCVFAKQGTAINGVGANTFNSQFTSARLTELVELQLENSLVSSLGLKSTPYVMTLATTDIAQAFDPAQVNNCTSSGTQFIAKLAPPYRSVLVGLQQNQILLAGHLAKLELSEAGIAAYEQEHPEQVTTKCVSAIVVSAKSQADTIVNQLRHGANFASIAKADSTDTSSAANGGSVGCFLPAQLVGAVASVVSGLNPGQISDPISFDNAYIIVTVTSDKGLAPVSEAAQVIIAAQDAAITTLVKKYSQQVSVSVNPQYGSWSESNAGAGVKAPTGPTGALLINPAEVTTTPVTPPTGS